MEIPTFQTSVRGKKPKKIKGQIGKVALEKTYLKNEEINDLNSDSVTIFLYVFRKDEIFLCLSFSPNHSIITISDVKKPKKLTPKYLNVISVKSLIFQIELQLPEGLPRGG